MTDWPFAFGMVPCCLCICERYLKIETLILFITPFFNFVKTFLDVFHKRERNFKKHFSFCTQNRTKPGALQKQQAFPSSFCPEQKVCFSTPKARKREQNPPCQSLFFVLSLLHALFKGKKRKNISGRRLRRALCPAADALRCLQ
jgi:hypothetical protein